MKRQRGRGRKPGGGGGGGGGGHHHPNRSMQSSGPEGAKLHGSATNLYERYLQLARDASSSGDRVVAENFLQHAEHYFRVLRAMQPAMPPPPQADRFGNELDFEGEDEGAPESETAAEAPEGAAAEAGGDQPDVDFPGDQQRPQSGEFNNNRDDGFRRRRGRRNRFRGEGEGQDGAPREFNQERAERQGGGGGQSQGEGAPPREGRRERPPREPRSEGGGEQQPAEGFSNGPRPAFLGSD